ncbi:MAG TPA: ribosome small subunit-dependent GTPase A, partial [Pirellulaceae bacterium]
MADKPRKVRADFRKNRVSRTRKRDLTEDFRRDGVAAEDAASSERISGKGELSRRRTVRTTSSESTADSSRVLDVDVADCLEGRVLCVSGLVSSVAGPDGNVYQCATRRLLKTL